MRADGMGHRVARIYAKRREALDQYVPMWLTSGQGAGQGTLSKQTIEKQAENMHGQGGQGKQGTQTTTGENTGVRVADATPGEDQPGNRQAVHVHGPDNHPVHPVPSSNGAGLLGQGARTSPCPPCPWTDLDAWCARLGAAGDLHARRVVLREWVAAAGGWSDPSAVFLPTELPAGLALARLKAHAHALRFEVRDAPDCPDLNIWLRAEPR